MAMNQAYSSYMNHLCVGCGVCATSCPQQRIDMAFIADKGYYLPTYGYEQCEIRCGICENVCPFVRGNPTTADIAGDLFANKPGMAYDEVLGYYLDLYAGFSAEHRLTSASGGMVTWLLETLLEKGEIDGAVCVGPDSISPTLFNFRVARTVEDVRACSGSCYQPVEISHALREILVSSSRYAIVALPCMARALRLAIRKNARLRSRIRFIIGLVCGQMKSRHFVDYLCQKHANRSDPSHIVFRHKPLDRPANDFMFRFTWVDGHTVDLSFLEAILQPWTERWFTLEGCDYCDDVFAECADATFMDAWLPEYQNNPQGHNIFIVRDPDLLNIVRNASISGELETTTLTPERVRESQVGVIYQKRVLAPLHASRHNNVRKPPVLRSSLNNRRVDLRFEAWVKARIRQVTQSCDPHDVLSVERRLRPIKALWTVERRFVHYALCARRAFLKVMKK